MYNVYEVVHAVYALFLTDSEQQEIYHAARTIQYAFRKHKIQVLNHIFSYATSTAGCLFILIASLKGMRM